ncbi:NAD(P)H-dependent oxidoreductase [soil metagenome]
MITARKKLAIVIGSVRRGRFGPTVANWFASRARQHEEFEVDVIDLADFDFPVSMVASTDVDEFARRIAVAAGIVIVTPEYNHSYPGPLKMAIDSIGKPWRAKPVALVSYGGMSGGLRSVEPLRVVFAEVHAMTIRDTVSFHGVWDKFDDNGDPRDPESANAAAQVVLDQLTWWARALKTAREVPLYAR